MVSTGKFSSPIDEHEEPKSRRQKELESARALLEKAHDILQEANESYIANNSRPRRQYPTFDPSEVKIGPLLGVGGFGLVFEVREFRLCVPQEVHFQNNDEDAETNETKITKSGDGSENRVTDAQGRSGSMSNESSTPATSTAETNNNDNGEAPPESPSKSETKKAHKPVDLSKLSEDETHYDIKNARTIMSQMVRRNGGARYAIKRLHNDLSELERARGMIDLALEATYLSVLWHPNIVKMRAIASGNSLEPNFFIIMDRLYEILDHRFEEWVATKKRNKGGLFGRGANHDRLRDLLIERLTVAYDLAAAFWYMHEHRLVYRDLKKENIGFDIRGDVKVFDFGLCKSLSPASKARDSMGREVYGFQLTPRTGSVPYMAPEVAECKPYDTQCDVFSFAVLLWELMSLKPAFDGYTRREFYLRVVKRQERHAIPQRSWTPLVRVAVKEAWDHDPQKRPNMKRVAALIRGDLNDLTSDPSIRNRTTHMKDRSRHSQRIFLRGMSAKGYSDS